MDFLGKVIKRKWFSDGKKGHEEERFEERNLKENEIDFNSEKTFWITENVRQIRD